ncbi:MAG: hypothetical protein U0228_16625 [Myxococcaceae bacterium]
MLTSRVAVVVLLAPLVAACPQKPMVDAGTDAGDADAGNADAGDVDAGEADAGPHGEVLAAYRDVFGALCDFRVRCGVVRASDRDDCVEFYLSTALFGVVSPAQLDHLSVSPRGTAQLEACKAELMTSRCQDVPRSCNFNGLSWPALAGHVPTGGACLGLSVECANPGDLCVGATCPGQCQAKTIGSLDAPCTTARTCNPGLFCESLTNVCRALKPGGAPCSSSAECQTRCLGQTCQVPASLGQPCMEVSISVPPCDATTYCSSTFVCVASKATGEACGNRLNECALPNLCIRGVCAPLGEVGSPCSAMADCRAGLRCDPVLTTCQAETVVGTGQPCTGVAVRCAAGESCIGSQRNPDGGLGLEGACAVPTVGSSCSFPGWCPPASYCDQTEHCAAAAVGTPCQNSSECQTSDYCALGSTCAPRILSGQGCVLSDSCAVQGERCIGTTMDPARRCQRPAAAGEPCLTPEGCAATLSDCVNSVCVSAGHVGEPCTPNLNFCMSGACLARRCVAPLADGVGGCTSFDDCQSSTCSAGRCGSCP